MRHLSATLSALLACAVAPLGAQGIADRVARLPAGEIRMTFAARSGVCGDGQSFIGDAAAPEGMSVYWYGGEGYGSGVSTDWRGACAPGPVRVRLLKAGDVVTDVRVFVGGAWRGPGQDLGTVGTADAVAYLLGLARTAPQRAGGAALLAANLADSVALTAPLLAMARDRTLQNGARERALRWLPDVADREGSTETADRAARDIMADATDLPSVRDRAIRALSPGETTDAFLRDQYPKLGPAALRDRVLRQLGESAGAANVTWLRGRAMDVSEPLEIRDRALRVLGGDLGQQALLRQIYPGLAPVELKDRVIRMVGEEGGEEGDRWLRGIVENPQEPASLRDRALRMLGEHGSVAFIRALYPRLGDQDLKERALRLAAESGDQESVAWLLTVTRDESQSVDLRDRALRSWAEAGGGTAELVKLYDDVGTSALRQRLIRLLAERADDVAIDKLIAVARTDPDEGLRRFAVRRLAETGSPKAKQFIEETVKR